ncbi:hypothetical protein GVN20_25970 [Runella sp. CRIBMP]|uniref:hypothetical protein n=1 Tax=Runella sp. CRIBMP TaxID=2683261 RepID=UPI0014120C49|nr:hypothetical protein [Runella sp. CRIBMP]NBB22830.1 hypothetical protein [Runella sp. CRIBMP]
MTLFDTIGPLVELATLFQYECVLPENVTSKTPHPLGGGWRGHAANQWTGVAVV